jgi:hypothetical protein
MSGSRMWQPELSIYFFNIFTAAVEKLSNIPFLWPQKRGKETSDYLFCFSVYPVFCL